MTPRLINTDALAAVLGISPRTIERWRIEGFGPPFMKAGRRVLYRECDVEAWLDAGRRFSTSESPP